MIFAARPALSIGGRCLVALPHDPRPAYQTWFHVPVNIDPGHGIAARLFGAAPAEQCSAEIMAIPNPAQNTLGVRGILTDQAVFTMGVRSQSRPTLCAGERAYVPVYLVADVVMPHPIYPDVEIAAGTYLTGGTFLLCPELAVTQRLDPGDYEVRVTVRSNAGSVSSTVSLTVLPPPPPIEGAAVVPQPPTGQVTADQVLQQSANEDFRFGTVPPSIAGYAAVKGAYSEFLRRQARGRLAVKPP